MLAGLLTGISILWTIVIALTVIGMILWILGEAGHAVGGSPQISSLQRS
ncbi:hypothetical protein ACFV8E_10060 [Streptomyces sp. NPDC059849]